MSRATWEAFFGVFNIVQLSIWILFSSVLSRREQCEYDVEMAEISTVDVEKLPSTMETSLSNRPGDRDPSSLQCLTRSHPELSHAWHFSRTDDFPTAKPQRHQRDIVSWTCWYLSFDRVNDMLFSTNDIDYIVLTGTCRHVNSPWKFSRCKFSFCRFSKHFKLKISHSPAAKTSIQRGIQTSPTKSFIHPRIHNFRSYSILSLNLWSRFLKLHLWKVLLNLRRD